MNYEAHYDRLVETRKTRTRKEGGYYERHHIVMKSMGGTDSSENLVYFTAREHFLAHWLLWRIHKNRQAAFAFKNMCTYKNRKEQGKERRIFSSIAYQEAKESAAKKTSEFFKGRAGRKRTPFQRKQQSLRQKGNPSFKKTELHKRKLSESNRGKKRSDETMENIAVSQRGKVLSAETKAKFCAFGRKHSEETKQKIANARAGIGHPVSEETKKKLSAHFSGRKKRQATCTVCGAKSDMGSITRWHNEKCSISR